MSRFLEPHKLLLAYALVGMISIALSNVVISLAAILALYYHFFIKKIHIQLPKKITLALGLFFCAMFLSSFFGTDLVAGVNRAWGFFYRMFPLFLVLAFIKKTEDLNQILFLLACSMTIVDCYAVWQGFHGNYRANAFSSHPMILAGFLVQIIPLLLVNVFYSQNQKIKRFYYFVILLSLGALLFNGTRGAWLAILLILLVLAIIVWRKRVKVLLASFLVMTFLVVAILQIPFIQERAVTLSDLQYQSNSERVLLWNSSWKMFHDYPVFGIGLGSFAKQYRDKYISPLAKEPELGHAHNNFFHMMAETGGVGLLSFIFLFGVIIYYGMKNYLKEKNPYGLSLAIITISLLLQGLTEFNFGDSAVIRLYWFLVGYCLIGMRILHEKISG